VPIKSCASGHNEVLNSAEFFAPKDPPIAVAIIGAASVHRGETGVYPNGVSSSSTAWRIALSIKTN
jgi:hypothetical protein